MTKETLREKEMKKQREKRIADLNHINYGLIAMDVLFNKKSEYMQSFIDSHSDEDNIKIQVIDEIMKEITTLANEFCDKMILVD